MQRPLNLPGADREFWLLGRLSANISQKTVGATASIHTWPLVLLPSD